MIPFSSPTGCCASEWPLLAPLPLCEACAAAGGGAGFTAAAGCCPAAAGAEPFISASWRLMTASSARASSFALRSRSSAEACKGETVHVRDACSPSCGPPSYQN